MPKAIQISNGRAAQEDALHGRFGRGSCRSRRVVRSRSDHHGLSYRSVVRGGGEGAPFHRGPSARRRREPSTGIAPDAAVVATEECASYPDLTIPASAGQFPVPILGPGTARELRFQTATGERSINQIARGLLKAGLLKESDWQGEVAKSVQVGLARWAKEQGAGDLKMLKHLSLGVCDSCEAWSFEARPAWWLQMIEGSNEKLPVGYFTLAWDSDFYVAVQIKKRINDLERHFPMVGASLLALLGKANVFGVEILTPEWGDWEVGEMFCDEDDEDDEDMSNLSPSKYARLVPEIVRCPKYMGDRVEQAAQMASYIQRAKPYRKILGWMLDLKVAMTEAEALGMQIDQTDSIEISSGDNLWSRTVCALTWCGENCPVIQMADYHVQSVCDDGRMSDIAWAHGFQLHLSDDRMTKGKDYKEKDGSLGAAIAALKATIRVTVLVDKILGWLDKPQLNVRLAETLRPETKVRSRGRIPMSGSPQQVRVRV